ncbi:inositol monophosphatase family protein [Tessaracoccus sp. Z1128]
MDTEGIADLLKETAAEVVMPRFRQLAQGEIEEKRPGDFVTVADREAEVYLTRLLKAAYPSAVVIGEEAVHSDPGLLAGVRGAEHAFIIDPIDGTRNFVAGKDEFGVMLAEVRGGVATRGWIYQPRTGRSYTTERGAGARLNGAPIDRPRTERAPLGATSKRSLHGYTAEGRLSPVVESRWCCAFDYPLVLHGDVDFLVYTTLHPWDHLAGSLMVTESGGVSRTMDGLSYTLQSKSRGLVVAGDTLTWMTAQQNWPER